VLIIRVLDRFKAKDAKCENPQDRASGSSGHRGDAARERGLPHHGERQRSCGRGRQSVTGPQTTIPPEIPTESSMT